MCLVLAGEWRSFWLYLKKRICEREKEKVGGRERESNKEGDVTCQKGPGVSLADKKEV